AALAGGGQRRGRVERATRDPRDYDHPRGSRQDHRSYGVDELDRRDAVRGARDHARADADARPERGHTRGAADPGGCRPHHPDVTLRPVVAALAATLALAGCGQDRDRPATAASLTPPSLGRGHRKPMLPEAVVTVGP